jgi:hypothetical protein
MHLRSLASISAVLLSAAFFPGGLLQAQPTFVQKLQPAAEQPWDFNYQSPLFKTIELQNALLAPAPGVSTKQAAPLAAEKLVATSRPMPQPTPMPKMDTCSACKEKFSLRLLEYPFWKPKGWSNSGTVLYFGVPFPWETSITGTWSILATVQQCGPHWGLIGDISYRLLGSASIGVATKSLNPNNIVDNWTYFNVGSRTFRARASIRVKAELSVEGNAAQSLGYTSTNVGGDKAINNYGVNLVSVTGDFSVSANLPKVEIEELKVYSWGGASYRFYTALQGTGDLIPISISPSIKSLQTPSKRGFSGIYKLGVQVDKKDFTVEFSLKGSAKGTIRYSASRYDQDLDTGGDVANKTENWGWNYNYGGEFGGVIKIKFGDLTVADFNYQFLNFLQQSGRIGYNNPNALISNNGTEAMNKAEDDGMNGSNFAKGKYPPR